MSSKVDIFILSGFLGSGKSTLLAKLIEFEQKQGRNIGVIMNEMGEISIDSQLIPKDTPIKELLNGCICCNLQGELSLRLEELLSTYELDAIYIESSGAAHLIETVDACTHPVLANKIEMKGIITVVNAKQWLMGQMSIKLKKLIREHIKYADVIVVNKLDTVQEDMIDSLIASVKRENRDGTIIPAVHADINPKIIFSTNHTLKSPSYASHKEEHAHFNLRTFTFRIEHPVNRIRLEKWLNKLPGQLYRAKGFVKLDESPGIYLFNYSYGGIMIERYRNQNDYSTLMVVIGENLDFEHMNATLIELQA
ncbi:GTP-binding protein [Evansella sp. AB-P1]|uniref:CobW family GTP-binding protein n=1 Tax=Evansella sp. AB-P1 TaxID=3037653 RepID=UPI0024200CAB|nr:GTP-binding protein [Evansella sp. AB-P1]MDG5785895.1 GTP-binding protein [Evansella sp. AB-P1]